MYKRVLSITLVPAIILGIALVIFALPHKQEADNEHVYSVRDTERDASPAETLYKSNCVFCHGTDLQGKIGPRLSRIGKALSEDQIYDKIIDGGGGMPTFKDKLSDKEAVELAEWLSSKL